MTLLSISQDAAVEAILPTPASIIGSADPNSVRILGLAKRSLQSVSRVWPWQELVAEHTFTTTAAAAQVGAIPSDFDYILPGTCWDRTANWRLGGPKTSQQWQRMQVRDTSGVFTSFRVRGDVFLAHGTPSSGSTVAYEYAINTPCQDASGTAQVTWAADTDVAKISEVLLTLDLKWRIIKSFGRAYDEDLNEFIEELDNAVMRNDDAPDRGVARYGDMAKSWDENGQIYNINTDNF